MPFDTIIAQPSAVRTLERALDRDRLASSYLFEGPSGVGKHRTAIALGQALLCERSPRRGCGACDTCRRIAGGSHPDVRVFAPREEGHRNIQVETVRSEILPVAHFAPFEGPAALLVFPDADVSFPAAHAEAANALLKTLEEPRPRVYFVLAASRPDRLLTTIRSRCQRVRFGRLPDTVVTRILTEHRVPEPDQAMAVALADGCADRALALAADGASARILGLSLRIDEAIERPRPGLLVDLAEELARDDRQDLVVDTLAAFYRDVAAASLGVDSAILFRNELDRIRSRARSLGAARAAARVERLQLARRAFDQNANQELAFDALLFALRDV